MDTNQNINQGQSTSTQQIPARIKNAYAVLSPLCIGMGITIFMDSYSSISASGKISDLSAGYFAPEYFYRNNANDELGLVIGAGQILLGTMLGYISFRKYSKK